MRRLGSGNIRTRGALAIQSQSNAVRLSTARTTSSVRFTVEFATPSALRAVMIRSSNSRSIRSSMTPFRNRSTQRRCVLSSDCDALCDVSARYFTTASFQVRRGLTPNRSWSHNDAFSLS